MLTRWVVGVVVVAGIAAGAQAQEPTGPTDDAVDAVRARQKIFMMEGVLERAVQLGVDNLRRRVAAVIPADTLLQGGVPAVRGFRLEGYGLFFDVEVPALRRSVAWSLRTMNQTGMALARDLAQMRAFLQSIADPNTRAEFDRTLLRIQQQMGTAQQMAYGGGSPGQAVSAQAVPQPVAGQPVADQFADGQTASGTVVSGVDAQLLDDPGGAYTHEVQAVLLDAIVDNSAPLALDDDEWLTIAARDNARSNPLMTGDPDVKTLILRVRGADLSAYQAGRLTVEQIRLRVQIGEF